MAKPARLSQRLAQIEPELESSQAKSASGFEITIATSREDRLQAARLVARVYKTEGYLPGFAPSASGDFSDAGASVAPHPFFTFHHLLPEARVFVAKHDGNVVGTLTVILDSPAGLPLESLYGDEVAAMRVRGRRVSELCSLAIDPNREHTSLLFLNLFRQANAYLVHLTSATDFLVTLKPSHQNFYASRLGFTMFGAWKQDARFGDADTVAMGLSREHEEELALPETSCLRVNRIMALVFGRVSQADLQRLQVSILEGRLTITEIFERLRQNRDLLAQAAQGQREYLRRCYGDRLVKGGLEFERPDREWKSRLLSFSNYASEAK